MNHTCLCLPSRSWYSFADPGGMEGWVGFVILHGNHDISRDVSPGNFTYITSPSLPPPRKFLPPGIFRRTFALPLPPFVFCPSVAACLVAARTDSRDTRTPAKTIELDRAARAFRRRDASCLFAAPLEMCGSTISATRQVPVVYDVYPYPYPRWLRRGGYGGVPLWVCALKRSAEDFYPRLHWDGWLLQSHV